MILSENLTWLNFLNERGVEKILLTLSDDLGCLIMKGTKSKELENNCFWTGFTCFNSFNQVFNTTHILCYQLHSLLFVKNEGF